MLWYLCFCDFVLNSRISYLTIFEERTNNLFACQFPVSTTMLLLDQCFECLFWIHIYFRYGLSLGEHLCRKIVRFHCVSFRLLNFFRHFLCINGRIIFIIFAFFLINVVPLTLRCRRSSLRCRRFS